MFSIHDEDAVACLLPANGSRPLLLRRIQRAVYKRCLPDLPEIAAAAELPAELAARLAAECRLHELSVRQAVTSANGETTRFLFGTEDGLGVEAVIMRHPGGRNTLCVSSQVGCPMACSFCATGQLGLTRDLTAWEIVDQVDLARRHLAAEGGSLRNVVFMGMGEPFLNYEAVSRAIGVLTARHKYQFGHKFITVSTCGIVEGIEAFGRDHPQASLAISLHAPDDATRQAIMPAARAAPVAALMAALDAYAAHTGRRVFYEYIMIKGLTDRDWQADALAALLAGRNAHVNLIPWNPGIGDPGQAAAAGFAPAAPAALDLFQTRLRATGIPSTVRVTMGSDIAAACGQLAGGQAHGPGEA
jgi:23S rRNA (adenine2503-C2)-methyltransferase